MTKQELGGSTARRVALAVAVFGLCAGAAWAAPLDDARRTESQTVQEGAESQRKIDQIDEDRGELFRDYKAVLNQLDKFKRYNNQLRDVIKDQETQMASLREQIDRVKDIDKDIVPLVGEMLEGLEAFLREDVPIRAEERAKRLTELRELMPRSDITNAEKYRRVLEAYQIENDYGRSIEAYSAKVMEEGEERGYDYLSIGRVAFFRQTPDATATWIWDREQGAWASLPSGYTDAVRYGMDMAKQAVPPNLLVLPIMIPTQSAE